MSFSFLPRTEMNSIYTLGESIHNATSQQPPWRRRRCYGRKWIEKWSIHGVGGRRWRASTWWRGIVVICRAALFPTLRSNNSAINFMSWIECWMIVNHMKNVPHSPSREHKQHIYRSSAHTFAIKLCIRESAQAICRHSPLKCARDGGRRRKWNKREPGIYVKINLKIF